MATRPDRPDWPALVREHATRAAIDLPPATVDEIALHLDDLYTAARAEGLSDVDAQARAHGALEESALAVLRPHAARDARHQRRRGADADAHTPQRRSLSVLSAIRMAFRQFRQHPTFALVTVFVLGLGTGAATTVFTIVDAVVLRPLPYASPIVSSPSGTPMPSRGWPTIRFRRSTSWTTARCRSSTMPRRGGVRG